MIELPIIGSLMEAAGMIFEKRILKQKLINYKNYTVYAFLAIVLMMLPFVFLFWRFDANALTLGNALIFFAMVIVSVFANLLIFYSLKREHVTEFEPIWLMQPLFTILLAFLFFPTERDWVVVGLAFLASLALVASHVKKHHLIMNRFVLAAILGSFLFSLELILSRFILDYYSALTFYFLRCLFVFAIVFFVYHPSPKPLLKAKGVWWMTLLVGIFWIFYRVIIYSGFLSLGIVYTTALFILSPVFLFLFAIVFLKERPSKREIFATCFIVACVIAIVVLKH